MSQFVSKGGHITGGTVIGHQDIGMGVRDGTHGKCTRPFTLARGSIDPVLLQELVHHLPGLFGKAAVGTVNQVASIGPTNFSG